MSWPEALSVAAVLAGSAVVQAAVGFGFALFAVPLLLVAGLSLQTAIAVCATVTVYQATLQVWQFRRHILWRPLLPVVVAAAACVPLGTLGLHLLTSHSRSTARAAVGAAALLALAATRIGRVEPRERIAAGWGVGAGVACGILAGMVGTGGPPIVLWVMAHRWTNPQSRVAMWIVFVSVAPAQFVALSQRYPADLRRGATLALVSLPFTLVGMAAGLRLGHRFSKDRLRAAAMVLLTLLAVSLLADGLRGLWSGRV